MALKKGLTTGQDALSSWTGAGDPCQWSYVTCDYSGRVSALCAPPWAGIDAVCALGAL